MTTTVCIRHLAKTRGRGAFDYDIFDKSRTQKPKDYDFCMMAYENNTVGAKIANLVLAIVLVFGSTEARMVDANR